MRTKNQEISFEVAEENETVTVDIKTPFLFTEPLPTPPTAPTTPTYDIYSPHPDDVEVPPKGMAYSDWKEQKLRERIAEQPTPTTAYKLQPHEEEFLKKAKSQKERNEIWKAIRADQQIRLRREKSKQIQKTLQTNRQQRKAFPTRANKKRRAPLTILQTIRFKTGAKYNLLAAERIVAHICRRQGGKKNQERRGCFESIPNMAKACRIRINRFRKLIHWLTKAGILIAEHREHRSTKYTVAPGRQMIMPMIIDDLKLTPAQNAVARILLRYGIISIRQAAKFAHASKNTASRTIKLLEEKQVVKIRRIQGCTSEYKFCRKVLKFFGRTVPKRPGGLSPKRPSLRNSGRRLSELRTERAIQQAKERAEERREAWKKANPKEAAILKEINEIGKATGNFFQAWKDNCHRLKTA